MSQDTMQIVVVPVTDRGALTNLKKQIEDEIKGLQSQIEINARAKIDNTDALKKLDELRAKKLDLDKAIKLAVDSSGVEKAKNNIKGIGKEAGSSSKDLKLMSSTLGAISGLDLGSVGNQIRSVASNLSQAGSFAKSMSSGVSSAAKATAGASTAAKGFGAAFKSALGPIGLIVVGVQAIITVSEAISAAWKNNTNTLDEYYSTIAERNRELEEGPSWFRENFEGQVSILGGVLGAYDLVNGKLEEMKKNAQESERQNKIHFLQKAII